MKQKLVRWWKQYRGRQRLLRVKRAILQEPARLRMTWYTMPSASLSNQPSPPCGTTACIAGWALHHAGIPVHDITAMELARNLLGLTTPESGRLFLRDHWPIEFSSHYHDELGPMDVSQIRENAQTAADRIDYFLEHRI